MTSKKLLSILGTVLEVGSRNFLQAKFLNIGQVKPLQKWTIIYFLY